MRVCPDQGQPINKTLTNARYKASDKRRQPKKQQKTIKNKQKQIKSNHGGELWDCGNVETLRFNVSTVPRPGGTPPDKRNEHGYFRTSNSGTSEKCQKSTRTVNVRISQTGRGFCRGYFTD